MFGTNSYAKIKKLNSNDSHYIEAFISTTQKNKQTGYYECDFYGSVKFVGNAFQKTPTVGQRIKILSCGVQNCYIKDGNIDFLKNPKYIVFDYELLTDDETSDPPKKQEPTQAPLVLIEDDGPLPF